jgi:hypothetical protein
VLPAPHLAVDAMNAYDGPRALAAARAVAAHGLWWLEDICDPLDLETHAAAGPGGPSGRTAATSSRCTWPARSGSAAPR